MSSKVRYASTDEMKVEFGDYRVNNGTNNLCDSSKEDSVRDEEVSNDPYTEEANNDSERGFKVSGY